METKKPIMEEFQRNLKQIRQMMDLSTQELADLIGVTRQTINNLESGKSALSETNVIALLAVIDRRLFNDSYEFHKIKKILGLDKYTNPQQPLWSVSLLDIWFQISGLTYKDYTPNHAKEEHPMPKVIDILDSTQLTLDSDVIPVLVEKDEEIFIPVPCLKELDTILNRNILDETVTNQIIRAKRTIKSYEAQIHRWKSKESADSAILHLIEQKIADPTVDVINVYTTDEALAKECLSYQHKNAEHIYVINILRYENNDEIPVTVGSTVTYPKYLKHLEAAMWRNDIYLPDFNVNDSLAEEITPIPTLSGKELVTKYWAWYVRAGDIYRVYKKIKIHQGETVSVNVISFNNHCDVYVRVLLYSEALNKNYTSELTSLSGAVWKTLTYTAPQDCDYANLEILPKRDSEFDGEFNGMDGFLDDFKITR